MQNNSNKNEQKTTILTTQFQTNTIQHKWHNNLNDEEINLWLYVAAVEQCCEKQHEVQTHQPI